MCGILAPNHCGKCKVVYYCSRVHQVYDWKNGHKDVCSTKAKNGNDFLFPEYEIVRECDMCENESDEQNDSESEQKEIEKYNAMVQNGKAGTFQHEDVNEDLLQMANDEKDETFAKFRKAINYPEQILRYFSYKRIIFVVATVNLCLFDRYERGGKVLYISSHSQVTDVPKCPECDGDRQFEFQVCTAYSYRNAV